MRKLPYGTLLALLGLHAFVSLEIAGLLPGYGGSFYSFTVPHLAMGLVSLLLVLAHYRRPTTRFLTLACLAIVALPFTSRYALTRWPGGDDGAGLAWGFIVGGLSVTAAVTGIPLLIVGHRLAKRR